MSDALKSVPGWFEFPCAPVQERFFAHEQIAPGGSSQNIALRWTVTGPIDGPMVTRAFQLLIRRHESLRSTFEDRDGTLVQKVLPSARINVPVLDLRLLSTAHRDQDIQRISIEEARTPFNLATAPLLRIKLICLGDQDSLLLVTAHHIIADYLSMAIIAREFCAICNGLVLDEPVSLPPLEFQYSDYAVWCRAMREEGTLAPVEAYWVDRIAGFTHLAIATDRPRSGTGEQDAAITAVVLPQALTRQVERYARAQGATWFMTVVTALKLMLARQSGLTDILIGTQVAGRDQTELEGIVGPFINTILLRTKLSESLSFSDALDRVGETVREALDNSQMPLERLIEVLKPTRLAGRHPLFSVNVLQQKSFGVVAQDRISVGCTPSVSAGAIFDLSFFLVERPSEGWRFSCEYNTGLFDEATARGFLAETVALLERGVAQPGEAIALQGGAATDAVGTRHPGETHVRPARPVADPSPPAPVDRLEIEAKLLPIWQSALHCHSGNARATFSELGGHSLTALRLITSIEKAFATKIGFDIFTRDPRLEDLVALIDRDASRSLQGARFVTIQPRGSRTPIVALHNSLLFQPLARVIGDERPFHAVVPDEAVLDSPDTTYADIVAHYVACIRRGQPQGPYILLGHCFAGRIAYEAAQQLIAAGEVVDYIIAVDSWAPNHGRRKSIVQRSLAKFSYGAINVLRPLRKMVGGRLDWRHAFQKSKRIVGLASLPNEEEVLRIRRIEAKLASHTIRTYDGRVLVIRAVEEPSGLFLERDLAWGGLTTGDVTVRNVSGTHFTMFREPEVQDLARAIVGVIDEAP